MLHRGRGITIHRTDCVKCAEYVRDEIVHRLIEAEWQPARYNNRLRNIWRDRRCYANNRTGLLVDLSKIFTERKIDLRKYQQPY
ncbi:MAG: hypothetical protein ACLUTA_07330 [Blautia wexlerae]